MAGACSFLGACPFCPFSEKSEADKLHSLQYFLPFAQKVLFFHKLSGNKEFLRLAEGNVREKWAGKVTSALKFFQN